MRRRPLVHDQDKTPIRNEAQNVEQPIRRRTPQTTPTSPQPRPPPMRTMRQHRKPRSRPHQKRSQRWWSQPRQPANTMQTMPQAQNTRGNARRPPREKNPRPISSRNPPRTDKKIIIEKEFHKRAGGLPLPPPPSSAGGQCCSDREQVWEICLYAFSRTA